MTAIHLRLDPSHERAAAAASTSSSSSSSHRINNASSDPAEPCGEGDADNLLRDLEDAPAAADKGFVCANECHASFIFSRVQRASARPRTHHASSAPRTGWRLLFMVWSSETCLPLKKLRDANVS